MTMSSQPCGILRLYLLNHTFSPQAPDDLEEKLCLIFFFISSVFYILITILFLNSARKLKISCHIQIYRYLILSFFFLFCLFLGDIPPRAPSILLLSSELTGYGLAAQLLSWNFPSSLTSLRYCITCFLEPNSSYLSFIPQFTIAYLLVASLFLCSSITASFVLKRYFLVYRFNSLVSFRFFSLHW